MKREFETSRSCEVRVIRNNVHQGATLCAENLETENGKSGDDDTSDDVFTEGTVVTNDARPRHRSVSTGSDHIYVDLPPEVICHAMRIPRFLRHDDDDDDDDDDGDED